MSDEYEAVDLPFHSSETLDSPDSAKDPLQLEDDPSNEPPSGELQQVFKVECDAWTTEDEIFEEESHENDKKSTRRLKSLFACPVPKCSAMFDRISKLQQHALCHSDERLHECSHCGATFKREWHLKRHIQSKHELKRFACEYCPQVYSTSANLLRHVKQSHGDDSRHECSKCGRSFSSAQWLHCHLSRCEKGSALPHVCDICGQRFLFPNKLRRHQLHQHECSFCGAKAFKDAKELLKHRSLEHSLEDRRSFQCPQCEKSYAQMRNLRAHFERHHGNVCFNCDQCDKKFMHAKSLSHHKMLVHSSKGEEVALKKRRKRKERRPRKDKGLTVKPMANLLTNRPSKAIMKTSLEEPKHISTDDQELNRVIAETEDPVLLDNEEETSRICEMANRRDYDYEPSDDSVERMIMEIKNMSDLVHCHSDVNQ